MKTLRLSLTVYLLSVAAESMPAETSPPAPASPDAAITTAYASATIAKRLYYCYRSFWPELETPDTAVFELCGGEGDR